MLSNRKVTLIAVGCFVVAVLAMVALLNAQGPTAPTAEDLQLANQYLGSELGRSQGLIQSYARQIRELQVRLAVAEAAAKKCASTK